MRNIFLFSMFAMAVQLTGCSSAPVLVPSTAWEQKSVSESKATESAVPSTPLVNPEKDQNLFCSYNGGLEFGRQGGIYTGNCPKSLERTFKKGYLKGKAEYDKQQAEKGNK